jgi:hypothetical protein
MATGGLWESGAGLWETRQSRVFAGDSFIVSAAGCQVRARHFVYRFLLGFSIAVTGRDCSIRSKASSGLFSSSSMIPGPMM